MNSLFFHSVHLCVLCGENYSEKVPMRIMVFTISFSGVIMISEY